MIQVGSSLSCRPDVRVDPKVAVVSHFLSEAGLDAAAAPAIGAWIAAVASWNRRIDLTAARSDDELVDLMLADGVVLAQRLAQGERTRRVVDVGTGAGAPGLPLAILRPDLEVTLVEPLQKRVALLRMTAGRLQREGGCQIEVVRGKGEDLASGPRFDVAVSRATLGPPAWLALGARLADEVVVMLAQHEPPTLEGWATIDDHVYHWPLTGAERRLVIYRRR